MVNAPLKAICPLKYPVLLVFSVATAVSSLPWVLQQCSQGAGGLRKCSSAQVRPVPTWPLLCWPWPPDVGFHSQMPVVLLNILLPNRKVNKQLTFTNALLLVVFLSSPDVLRCGVPDASPLTGSPAPVMTNCVA